MYFIRTGPKSLSYCSQHCTNFYQTDAPTHHHNNLIFRLNCPTLPSSLLPAGDFPKTEQSITASPSPFPVLSKRELSLIESVLNNVAL